MKVAFTLNPYQLVGGGSFSFARVLAEELPLHGMDVVFDESNKVDVVLVFANYGTPLSLMRYRKWGARIVHRLDERIDPNETWARKRKHMWIVFLNSYADLTIFQSQFVRQNMDARCESPYWRVIHNGVDQSLFNPDGDKVALEGRPAALHVSWSIGQTKRIDRIVELLEQGPSGLVIHCVGRHAEIGQPWLRHPRLRLHGPKSRHEVASFMRSADFLFFPSEFEPCPNTVIEALASGLPCLYHPSGGTPELIGDAGVPIDYSLSEAIQSILDNRQTFRERSLKQAMDYTAKTVALKYVEAIKEVQKMPTYSIKPLWRRLWSLSKI